MTKVIGSALVLFGMLGCSSPASPPAPLYAPDAAPSIDAPAIDAGEAPDAPTADAGDAIGVGTWTGPTMSLRIGAASCGDVGDLAIEIDTHLVLSVSAGYDYPIGETAARVGCVAAASGYVRIDTISPRPSADGVATGFCEFWMTDGSHIARSFTVSFCDRPSLAEMPANGCR